MQTEMPAEATLPELEVQRPTAAMTTVTSLFFIWGFVTSLNDILIPHLQNVFSLSNSQAMSIQFAFFSAYFIFALPWGWVVNRIGYRNTMVTGLCVSAVGCLLFLPAASTAIYAYFLGALVILAGGITALQVAANPYVTALGPARTAASRLNLAQAFNSLGTTVAPYIGGIMIFGAANNETVKNLTGEALHVFQQQQASSVKLPYIILALILFVLAVIIRVGLPAPTSQHTQTIRVPKGTKSSGNILANPQVLLATIGIFLYVGGEVSIGSFLVKYLNLPHVLGVSELTASKFVSLYWGGAMVGRFAGAALLQKVKSEKLLSLFAAIAAVLVLVSTTGSGWLAAVTILSVGLFNSIMFPSIFAIGVHNMGSRTSEASAAMVMAIVGGALIPKFQGMLADAIGLQHALLVPLVCYLYIMLFGIWGSKQSEKEVKAHA